MQENLLQNSVTSIDRMELLTFEKIELADKFTVLEKSVPEECLPLVKQLQRKYGAIFNSWNNLCEELHSKIEETKDSNKFIQQEQDRLKRIEQEKEKQRNRLYAMKEVKLQVQEKEFQDSLLRIQEMWEDNIEELEHTLNEHKQNRLKRGAEQLSHMEEVEREMSQFLELTPRLNLTLDINRLREDYTECLPSHRRTQSNPRSATKKKDPDIDYDVDINESAEFDKLMDELQEDKDVDQSRMSMDKTIGGWASEYDSEPEANSFMNQTSDLNSLLAALQERKLLREDEIRAIENMRDNATETYRMDALKDMLKVLAKKVNLSKREVTAEDSKNFNAPFASPRRFEFKSGRKNSFHIVHEMQSPNISMDLALTSPRNILPTTGTLLKTQTSFQGSSFLDTNKNEDSKEVMNLESLLNASCEQLSWMQPISFIDGTDESTDQEGSKYILEQDWSSLNPPHVQLNKRSKLSGDRIEIDSGTSQYLDSTKWTASLKSRFTNQSELRESVDGNSVSFVNNI